VVSLGQLPVKMGLSLLSIAKLLSHGHGHAAAPDLARMSARRRGVTWLEASEAAEQAAVGNGVPVADVFAPVVVGMGGG
jgi:hypothetical protein